MLRLEFLAVHAIIVYLYYDYCVVAFLPGNSCGSGRDPNSKSKSELVQTFISSVEESIQKSNFVSLVLRGVKKKKKKSNIDDDLLRGSIRQVSGRIIRAASSSKSRNKKTNRQNNLDDTSNIDDDSILLFQITLKYHGATDICKNVPIEDVAKTIYDLILDPALASEWGIINLKAQPIQGAQLTTTDTIFDLRLDTKSPSLREKKAIADDDATSIQASTSTIPQSHDRIKMVPLSNQAAFFKALGVTNENGKPKPKMQGKLRQCQKFVEIVGKIVDELQGEEQKNHHTINLVDMGCGRAYLTFSLHHYLNERYESITATGIDVRPKLINEINGIAKGLGGNFDTLNFEEGTIENLVTQASTTTTKRQEEENDDDDDDDDPSLSILVALHACDTATDDALYSGIAQKADVIVVAPCCHKQVRPQLNAHFSSTRQTHPLSSILKHGVYRDRISEQVTDSLRALLLEYAGYQVKVFEFIGGEHTSKNVMITAIRNRSVNRDKKPDTEAIWQEIRSLASLHGISQHKLAQWMHLNLVDEEPFTEPKISIKKGKNASKLSKRRMPPSTRIES
ncbi:hypothetical protein FRACYDRAFT_223474 [Fragilariopsis cylindrus CCMP1102]|uniref:Methyltransferase domain-containing protein n=1 Tax=Fragilariopsis cylindrus CCMP1102 TaxID=635003 RepID=A0A1E7FWJ3_9STRA|nr:hypothetical protein FRACYDRAFT_223474 [Fragilariopsis cylindrus CCMP1102]|eukprot:OEU22494.1 hypothetical protein FRACYDRAFT_223474 [Fragilariopsis cylindrus CCMP1102]